MTAFVMWAVCGLGFVCLGIYAFCAKKPVHFWNIQEVIQVNDVRKYNKAMGILWIVAAVLFVIIGIPILFGESMAWISILGAAWWAILLMVLYTRIEKKYRI